MTRVALMPARWLALTAIAASLCALAAADASFQIALASPKLVLSAGAQQLKLRVTPPQSKLTELLVETIVDTAGSTVASDLKLAGNGEDFSVTLKGQDKLPAGLYKMKVSADSTYEVLPFKVTVPVEIATAKVNGAKLAFGDKIKTQQYSSGSGDALKVEVSLQSKVDKTPVAAHQVFLRFTHTTENVETYFVLAAGANANEYSADLSFALLSKKFSYKSGEHTVQLIVGDPSFESGLTWNLGVVDLLLGAAPPQPPSPLYAKPLLHESDTTLKALPEIKHVMRPQDKRPPIVVSLAFSAAVLAPLGAFLLFALKLQVNLRKLFSGSVFLFGVGFLGSLGAILVLFAWYWVKLTMYQTLGYLGVLATVNLWFGHLTLKRLAHSKGKAKAKLE